MNDEKLVCVYCNAQFTKEMMEVYEGSYGCETGCTTVEVVVTCSTCGRVCYEKSELGGVYEETTDEEWEEILKQARENGLTEIKIAPTKTDKQHHGSKETCTCSKDGFRDNGAVDNYGCPLHHQDR